MISNFLKLVKKQQMLFFYFVIFFAIILRIVVIFKYGNFWSDEMFSVTYSQKPWVDTFRFWLWETNPPLHMLILKIWFYIFPITEFFARLPSLLLNIASIYFLYIFARDLFGKRIGIISATIFSLNFYSIFISATARTYSLFVFLIIINVYYFYKLFIDNNASRREKIIYGISTFLLLFTHLTAILTIISQFVILVVLNKKAIKDYIKINFVPLLIWLIWVIPSLYIKFLKPSFGSSWFFQTNDGWRNIATVFHLMLGGSSKTILEIPLIILFFSTVIFLLTREKHKKEKAFIIILILFIIPIINSTMIGLWNMKFLIPAFPWIIILLTYILNNYLKSELFIFVIITILMLSGLSGIKNILPLEDWKTVDSFIKINNNLDKKRALIFSQFSDRTLIQKYIKDIAIIPYCPNCQESDWDQKVITENYLRYQHADSEISDWIKNTNIGQYDEIYLLTNDDQGINLKQALEKTGWKKRAIVNPKLIEYKELIEYVRN